MLFSGFSFSHVQMINRLSEKDDRILESRKGLFFFPLVQLRKDYSIYNKLIFFLVEQPCDLHEWGPTPSMGV